MRRSLILTLALTLLSVTSLRAAQEIPPAMGSNLASVTGGDFKNTHVLIEKKCTSCHTDQRIREALATGKDMQAIQLRMEQKGLSLTGEEKSVLGIFWQETPLKRK